MAVEEEKPEASQAEERPLPEPTRPLPALRLGLTGFFMGLANLVPGVSGGTMVLALGLYEEFIQAFSDVTRLRLRRRPIIVLAVLFGVSALTIFGLAGPIQFLMEKQLSLMLALFIGMTLGGVPTLYKEMRPLTAQGVGFAVAGIAVMALIAFVLRPDTGAANWGLFFLGGVVGSSAMILPGISGSYMLLILGLYLPIINGINAFKDAAGNADVPALLAVGTGIILPVGLGLVVGLVALSNLLKYLLEKRHRATVGFLMGLLLGSVLGLYPFKETSFDKLIRYAVAIENGETSHELRVVGAGWAADGESVVHRKLLELEQSGELRVRVVVTGVDKNLGQSDIERAREEQAIVIAYDVSVPREIRRLAADAEAAGVELLVVPNTEYSQTRAWIGLLLMLVGFGITFSLGRLGKESA